IPARRCARRQQLEGDAIARRRPLGLPHLPLGAAPEPPDQPVPLRGRDRPLVGLIAARPARTPAELRGLCARRRNQVHLVPPAVLAAHGQTPSQTRLELRTMNCSEVSASPPLPRAESRRLIH